MKQLSARQPLCGALLGLLFVAGCGGHASTTKNNSKETSGTSKDAGKTFTADPKGGKGAQGGGASGSGGAQGGGATDALPQPADTVNDLASPESDAGLSTADQGQAVMNPGAPVLHEPKPGGSGSGQRHRTHKGTQP